MYLITICAQRVAIYLKHICLKAAVQLTFICTAGHNETHSAERLWCRPEILTHVCVCVCVCVCLSISCEMASGRPEEISPRVNYQKVPSPSPARSLPARALLSVCGGVGRVHYAHYSNVLHWWKMR